MNEFEVIIDSQMEIQSLTIPFKLFFNTKFGINKIKIWDKDFIKCVKEFGTKVVFQDKCIGFNVFYPNTINEETIKKYLDCSFFDHLFGIEKCEFKWKDYICDLLLICNDLEHIRKQMQDVQKVYCEPIKNVPQITEKGKKIFVNYHLEHCKNFCRCSKEQLELSDGTSNLSYHT